jgi:hypothetical protein
MQEACNLHAERSSVTLAELNLGSDKRRQNLVHAHPSRVCSPTRHVGHEHEGLDLLQLDCATNVGAHCHTNRNLGTTIVTIQVERRGRGDGKRTAVQLEPVHPAVNSIRQVGSVVPLLIAVAASTDDDAIRGIHQMTLDALKNAVYLHLSQSLNGRDAFGEGRGNQTVTVIHWGWEVMRA